MGERAGLVDLRKLRWEAIMLTRHTKRDTMTTLYHRRSLVETVISVMKCKHGDAVSSRMWWRQFRELVAMCLIYNVERVLKVGGDHA